MSEQVMVKHIFWDPECQTNYPLLISKNLQNRIQTDQNFAMKMFIIAKNHHINLRIKKNVDENGNHNTAETTNSGNATSQNVNIEDSGHDDPESLEPEPLPQQDQRHNIEDNSSNRPGTSHGRERYKHCWQYADTKALIQSYGSHLDELHNPTHRKHFWDNVANDLVSQKWNITKELCQSKWNNLLKSYKQCKDKTGRGPSKFLFFDDMDEILGSKPSNSSSHTLSSLKKPNKNQENDVNLCNKKNCTTGNNKRPGKKGVENGKSKRKSICEHDEDRKIRDQEKLELQKNKLKLEEEKLAVEKEKCNLIRQYLKMKSRESS